MNLPITFKRDRLGMTLVEMLVVVGVFAMLLTMVSILLFGVLRGGVKSALTGKVRNEGAYALSVMTDQLKFAREMRTCSATGSTSLTFVADDETIRTYNLNTVTAAIEFAGERITTDAVRVTQGSCVGGVFKCDVADRDANVVTMCFVIDAAVGTGSDATAPLTFQTQVVLRNVDQ